MVWVVWWCMCACNPTYWAEGSWHLRALGQHNENPSSNKIEGRDQQNGERNEVDWPFTSTWNKTNIMRMDANTLSSRHLKAKMFFLEDYNWQGESLDRSNSSSCLQYKYSRSCLEISLARISWSLGVWETRQIMLLFTGKKKKLKPKQCSKALLLLQCPDVVLY